MNDDDAWFAPKRFGYGAGLPIRWQGWASLALFIAVLALAEAARTSGHLAVATVVILIDIAAMIWVAARRTRGGWRWRAGGER